MPRPVIRRPRFGSSEHFCLCFQDEKPRGLSMRVLGLDPGSRFTGYGILELAPGGPRHVDNGVVSLKATLPLAVRLSQLSASLSELIEEHAPDVAAIESVFTHKNVQSALVLAHARGALMAVLGRHNIAVHEYAPAAVKTAMTGFGRADKAQMQKMVCLVLKLPALADVDASDALAVAFCHLRNARLQRALAGSRV
jgi:crossover junction endodeoxyribonuclease RuvC